MDLDAYVAQDGMEWKLFKAIALWGEFLKEIYYMVTLVILQSEMLENL